MKTLLNKCDNIINFIDVKKTKNNLYLVMEYCEDGSLEHYIQKNGNYLSETETWKILK